MSWAPKSPGTITAVYRRSAAETAWLIADATVGAAARYCPDHLMHRLADTGRDQRRWATLAALRYFRQLVPALVTEILDQLDLTALIRDRVDLVGLARYLVAAIDLPEIIRGSIGSPTSEAGQDLLVQSVETDEAVAAWVDRVFRR